ncbi:MAG: FAD-dependent oxidoreductase [Pseudomonadota bacterium]
MTKDVIVLGAGIVGICTALSLLERGARVTVVDRGEPAQETSYGNAGIISPWSIIPQSLPGVWRQVPRLMLSRDAALSVRAGAWTRMLKWGWDFLKRGRPDTVEETAGVMEILCAPSIELYRRHLRGTGAEDLVRDSYYVHAFRDARKARLDAIDYRIRRERGADLALASRDDLKHLEPALSEEFEAAVLIRGQARAVSPGRIGEVLAGKVKKLGGELMRGDIKSLRKTDAGWTIEYGSGRMTSETIVVSLGAWSPQLLEPLGIRVPLMAERGYHVEFPQPGIEVNHSVMDVDRKVVASSMEDGLRVAGLAEFAPVDAKPDVRKHAQMERHAQAMFPDLDPSAPRHWMGRRPSFPDSLPAIGNWPSLEGLFLNFGHSHYGLMMAPMSGEIAADMIFGVPQNRNTTALSPDRFAS